MKILCFGSLNVDCVYKVPHIVVPGETISSINYAEYPGGKGANQAVAAARAGGQVFHAGKIGKDGEMLIEVMIENSINTDNILVDSNAGTGRAIIQVETANAENAIILYPGANVQISQAEIDTVLDRFGSDTWLIAQNEINNIQYLIKHAKEKKMRICYNPAPFNQDVIDYPLNLVDILILNETEATGICGETDNDTILNMLSAKLPDTEIILTLGAEGACCKFKGQKYVVPGEKVNAIDTTAAGDTFIGYYLNGRIKQMNIPDSLKLACKAASIAVTKTGAIPSIPFMNEVF